MDIILIGSGNTATILGRKSISAGHRIIQVYSRRQENAAQLARQLYAEPISTVSAIEKKADLMIVALRDDAILPFIQAAHSIPFPVVHTAGAVPCNTLKNPGNQYGVLYPLQSLKKEIELIPPLTLLIDGNSARTLQTLVQIATSIAENVIEADDGTRLKYHLAATLVNNFTNFLFVLTEDFCKREKISFTMLQPLMEETVMRLRDISPVKAQTGPAIRSDLRTQEVHRKLIHDYPALSRIYEMFTQEIQNFYTKQ